MVIEILISFCVCASLLLFIWYLRGLLLRPVRLGKNISLKLSVCVCESAPELEASVRSVLWLIENGTLPAQLELVDQGMDAQTRQVAEAMAQDKDIGLRRMPDGGKATSQRIRES